MAVAPPVPRLPYLPVSTPASAAASLRRLGAAGARTLSGGLYAAGASSGLQVNRVPRGCASVDMLVGSSCRPCSVALLLKVTWSVGYATQYPGFFPAGSCLTPSQLCSSWEHLSPRRRPGTGTEGRSCAALSSSMT